MEHHFVQRLTRLLPSSLSSCKYRSVPDVIESSIPITKTFHPINGRSAAAKHPQQPFPNLHKNHSQSKSHNPKLHKKETKKLHHSKHCNKTSDADHHGRRCPPATPINHCSSSNSGWFSSSPDDEVDRFDGKSDTILTFSSCSSESFHLKSVETSRHVVDVGCSSSTNTIFSHPCVETNKSGRKNPTKSASNPFKTSFQKSELLKGCDVVEPSAFYYGGDGRETSKILRKSRPKTRNPEASSGRGRCLKDGEIEESYAVEKSSSDPHGDFMNSMVEMIVEKQIFGAKDLEKLLECFLLLNSPRYHMIILEVFTQICDTLFSGN